MIYLHIKYYIPRHKQQILNITISYFIFLVQSTLKPHQKKITNCTCMSKPQWPRGLRRRGSAAARLLRLRVRIPPSAWMSVCCECCVLSRWGLCDGLLTRPEESYRLWRVGVWSWSIGKKGGPGPLGWLLDRGGAGPRNVMYT